MFASGKTNAVANNAATYIEDVFSTYLYTGNGSTQTITNGIDLSGKGGLVWIKNRSSVFSHNLTDTARGAANQLFSNSTSAQSSDNAVTGFNSNGFGVQTDPVNEAGSNIVSWTFRKQPKFFDVVTYTGNAVTSRTVAHNLGSVPGWIIIKRTDSTSDWGVMARRSGFTSNYATGLKLNATNARTSDYDYTVGSDISSTVFPVFIDPDSGMNAYNVNGATYVAYLFAHNAGGFGLTGTDNVISCGSYTGNGSATGPVIDLGYEPQWVLIKNASASADWVITDNMRGWTVAGQVDGQLFPNSSGAETSVSRLYPTATGFGIDSTSLNYNTNGSTYIYIAIRRGPMKVPTSGTSVFTPISRTGTGATAAITSVGFPPDWVTIKSLAGDSTFTYDKLRGPNINLKMDTTNADQVRTNELMSFDQSGFTLGVDTGAGVNYSGRNYANWAFRRAPSFFDEVCYTGNDVARNLNHNLAVAPELYIIKIRSTSGYSWAVGGGVTGSSTDNFLILNSTAAVSTLANFWATPTSTTFGFGSGAPSDTTINQAGQTYVAYLFATCAGVSKVGSYTGNGSSQTINCGFTGGARFVLIKRTDSTGDWYVWDTARGIVTANDPHLSLNTTAAEVTTDDTIDTNSTGFVVNQVTATNVNVTSATYIFLAIA